MPFNDAVALQARPTLRRSAYGGRREQGAMAVGSVPSGRRCRQGARGPALVPPGIGNVVDTNLARTRRAVLGPPELDERLRPALDVRAHGSSSS